MPAVPPAVSAPSAHAAIVQALDRSTKHRRYSGPIVRWLMTDPDTRTTGRNIANCALRLHLEAARGPDESPEARLTAAKVCNARLCPYCEWRRSRVQRARLLSGAAALLEEHPRLTPLMLTLTVANVPVDGLRDTLGELHRAWDRLTRRQAFPTRLWYRRTEVTVSQPSARLRGGAPGVDWKKAAANIDSGEVTLHPHLHCLLFVPPAFFGRNYIKATEWAELWRQSLRVSYTPIIDVRRAYAKTAEDGALALPISAAMEASKYLTKQADLPSLGPLVVDFHQAVKGVRMRSVSGDLARYVSARDVTAAELLDQPVAVAPGGPPALRVVADWCECLRHYVPTPSEGGG